MGDLERSEAQALRRDAEIDHAADVLGEAENPSREELAEEAAEILSARIRTAYDELSVREHDWVPLHKLRPTLTEHGYTRSEVDAALLALYKADVVVIAPESHRRRNTPLYVDSALFIGGEANHLVIYQFDA